MDYILEGIKSINDVINGIVWGPYMLLFLLFVGLFFTVCSGFFQVKHFRLCFKNTIGSLFKIGSKQKENKQGISAFQAMTTALAGAIGTGNVVGVATAIALGGPGSIFWMWIAAIVGMMTIFAENVLGVKYRKVNSKGEVVGGPMYYIEYGLKQKWLAALFAIFCIFATLGMGNMTQANSIAAAMKESFSFEPKYTGVVLCIISGLIIFGGINRIAKFSEKIVPIMAGFYIIGGLIVIIHNANALPSVFRDIFTSAFSFKSAFGGAAGITALKAMKYGISRGVFSNEAGLGSSPIVYASSSEKDPVIQGMWGIFQVFFDTIIGCSITALCILSSGIPTANRNGAELSNLAFASVFGRFGSVFVAISITLFAFATITSWYFYGEKSLEYLIGDKYNVIFKSLYIVMILFACVIDLNLVWELSDTFNGLMAIPNLIALMLLSKEVIGEIRKYDKYLKNKRCKNE